MNLFGKTIDQNDLTIRELRKKVEDIESRMDHLDSLEIPIQILPDGNLPYHANPSDAGYDLFASETVYLPPGRSCIMPVGIKVAVPHGYEIQIRPRSGISSKVSLRVANSPGTIDSGYRGEVGVILYNAGVGSALTRMDQENAGPVDIKGNAYQFPESEREVAEALPRDTIVVQRGDRIAQMVIAKVVQASFVPVGDVQEVEGDRGGGFGSSGASGSGEGSGSGHFMPNRRENPVKSRAVFL